MAEKCRICGLNDVEHFGDICASCAMTQDPHTPADAPGSAHERSRRIPLSPDAGEPSSSAGGKVRKVLLGGPPQSAGTGAGPVASGDDEPSSTPVCSAGQAPGSSGGANVAAPAGQAAAAPSAVRRPISEGITKNIHVDTRPQAFLVKWIRALASGIPFAWHDDVTTFQVFPDPSGPATTLQGNACDQVILYGRVPGGSIVEDYEVEIYGRRDSKNNIIAHSIRNRASGTVVVPEAVLSSTWVWIISLVMLALLGVVATVYGVAALVWAAVILLCLTHLPTVFKLLGILFGIFFSLFAGKDQ